jgi:flagellar motility protein MotE (MotC chaperone)
MSKVSFIPLLFGCVVAAACAATPQSARALDGLPQGDPRAAQAAQPHAQRLAHHSKSERRRFKAAAQNAPAPQPAAQQAAPAQFPLPLPIPIAAALQQTAAAQPAPQTTSTVPGNPNVAAGAQPQPAGAPKPASEPKVADHPAEKPKPAPLPREVQQFCANTASPAVDARVAWEAEKLTELEARLRQRITEFEAKRAEYEDWLHKHDEAMKEAKEDIVSIYSRMRPDAAAAELSDMDEVMAASVLAKLNSRVASAILAEMDPVRAARIANAMVGPPPGQPGAPGGKKS